MIRLLVSFLSLALSLVAAHAMMRGWMPGGMGQWPPLVRMILAGILLTLGVRGFLPKRHSDRTPTTRKWNGFQIAFVALFLLLIHAGLLWILVASAPVVERIGIAAEPWLHPERAAKRKEHTANANADAMPGNALWHDHRARMLPERTDLRLSNRPEVFLRFETTEDANALLEKPAYLTAFSLSKFDQGVWTTPRQESTELPASADGWTSFPVTSPRVNDRRIDHEIFHGENPNGQNLLIALQGIERAQIAPLRSLDSGFVTLPDAEEDATGYQYRVKSRPLTLADLPQATPAKPRDLPNPDELNFPNAPRIANHLRDQTLGIIGENPTAQSLFQLESWLREAYDYSLITENPANLDPLENFLFSERRGHCEHFAMTAALMLRTIGIPTRISYGWTGGTWYGNRGLLVFRAREAHAWTEVWFEDFGWVVMDPTPPTEMIQSQSRIASADEVPPDPIEAFAETQDPPTPLRIDRIALVILATSGFTYFVLMQWHRRSYRRSLTPDQISHECHATSGYLAAWHAACPPRHSGETLRQQIRMQTQPPPFAQPLIDYHYRVRYTRAKPDRAFERKLERTILAWRKTTKSKGIKPTAITPSNVDD